LRGKDLLHHCDKKIVAHTRRFKNAELPELLPIVAELLKLLYHVTRKVLQKDAIK
jgi:hypothetical protein